MKDVCRLRHLVILCTVVVFVCWIAYITWSVLHLNGKIGRSATSNAIVNEEVSGRDLSQALGVGVWKLSVLPDGSRKQWTEVQLRVVNSGSNVQAIIATSPFDPTLVQRIQVFLMPIPLGKSLNESEEMDIVFTVEGGRSRHRVHNPFFGHSCAESPVPTDFAEDIVLLSTIQFINLEDPEKNKERPPPIKLMITFIAK